jgi:hypothetical protein
VTQGPRGYEIRIAGENVGRASVLSVGFHTYGRWYFYASSKKHGIPHKNTCDGPTWATAEEARDACVAYIKAALAAQ